MSFDADELRWSRRGMLSAAGGTLLGLAGCEKPPGSAARSADSAPPA